MGTIQHPVQIITRKMLLQNLEVFYPIIIAGANLIEMQKMNLHIMSLVNQIIIQQGYFQSPQTTQVNGYFEIKTN